MGDCLQCGFIVAALCWHQSGGGHGFYLGLVWHADVHGPVTVECRGSARHRVQGGFVPVGMSLDVGFLVTSECVSFVIPLLGLFFDGIAYEAAEDGSAECCGGLGGVIAVCEAGGSSCRETSYHKSGG